MPPIRRDSDEDVSRMRHDMHEAIVEVRACVRGLASEQKRQGEKIEDLYSKISPLSQWIGTANVGLWVVTRLGVLVVVVGLLWNVIGVVVETIAGSYLHKSNGQQIVLDPDALPPGKQVRRFNGEGEK